MSGILVNKPRLDRQKKGFNAAIESVFALNDSSWREMLLDQSPLFEIVDRTKLETLTSNAHFTNSWSKFIFSVVSAKLFVDSYA